MDTRTPVEIAHDLIDSRAPEWKIFRALFDIEDSRDREAELSYYATWNRLSMAVAVLRYSEFAEVLNQWTANTRTSSAHADDPNWCPDEETVSWTIALLQDLVASRKIAERRVNNNMTDSYIEAAAGYIHAQYHKVMAERSPVNPTE